MSLYGKNVHIVSSSLLFINIIFILSFFFVAHAPVTLSFIVLNGLFRIFFNEKIWALSMHRVVNNYEFYRLFTSGFVFSSPPVFMTGIIVAHIFRDIERQLGIFKFSSFISLSFVFTTASQMALSMAVSVLSGNSLRYLPVSGSYYYILACLPLYYRKFAIYSSKFNERNDLKFIIFHCRQHSCPLQGTHPSSEFSVLFREVICLFLGISSSCKYV